MYSLWVALNLRRPQCKSHVGVPKKSEKKRGRLHKFCTIFTMNGSPAKKNIMYSKRHLSNCPSLMLHEKRVESLPTRAAKFGARRRLRGWDGMDGGGRLNCGGVGEEKREGGVQLDIHLLCQLMQVGRPAPWGGLVSLHLFQSAMLP